jgi:hypothetical protein
MSRLPARLALGAGLLSLCAPGVAAGISLADHVDYPVGTSPNGLAAADLDDDGDVDLVCANVVSSDVSVLLNHGDGTFAGEIRHAIGEQARSVAIGDVDADGDPDLVVGLQSGTSQLAVLTNDGDGVFSSPAPVASLLGVPTQMLLAHLDTDTDLDLAVVLGSDAAVLVLPGTAGAGFGAATIHGIPTGSPVDGGVAAGDMDGDGDVDLVSTFIYATGAPRVLLNDGDGAFALAPSFQPTLNNSTPAVAVGDLDGQDGLDIAEVGNGSVRVSLNDGAGSFGPTLTYAPNVLTSSVTRMTVADVDMDGAPDVVVTGSSASQVGILFNDGAGAFAPGVAHATGSFTADVAVADLDGDGLPDVVTANRNAGSVSVLMNRGATAAPVTASGATGYALGPGVPNPSGFTTTVTYAVPRESRVRLAVHDVAGRKVRVLTDGSMSAGSHEAAWDGRAQDGRPVPAGVYFVRMTAGDLSLTRRIVRVR